MQRWGIIGVHPDGNILSLKVLRNEERPYAGVSMLS
jgi:hypothetical protein